MWFIFALVAALFWGAGDMFTKMGTDPRDKYSHLRMVVMVGAVMGIHALVLYLCTYRAYGPISGLQDWAASVMHTDPLTEHFNFFTLVQYLPVSGCYILSMAIGYAGLRYLQVSASSPVQNSSGAVVAILCFVFLGKTMEWPQFVAVALIVAGVTLLSVFDLKDENKARRFRGEVIEEKYTISAFAILFPIFYAVIDALGTFGDAVVLDGLELLTEEEAEIAYELTFLIVGILALLWIVAVKREKFRLWEQREKGLGAICETAGQFAYVYAMADNSILAAPLVSGYCLFSVLFSRIFLKEKLTARQYGAIAVAIVGIVILGVYDA